MLSHIRSKFTLEVYNLKNFIPERTTLRELPNCVLEDGRFFQLRSPISLVIAGSDHAFQMSFFRQHGRLCPAAQVQIPRSRILSSSPFVDAVHPDEMLVIPWVPDCSHGNWVWHFDYLLGNHVPWHDDGLGVF